MLTRSRGSFGLRRQFADYERLVSTVPLPELVPLIDGVPVMFSRPLRGSRDVRGSGGHRVDRNDISDTHITYFYDEDVVFSRVNSRIGSLRNAPPGTGSIQAEVYFSDKYRPLQGPRGHGRAGDVGSHPCGFLRPDDRSSSPTS